MRTLSYGLFGLVVLWAATAHADLYFTGDTTGGPTFLRPTSFSSVTTARRYQVIPFYVDTSGEYVFEVDSQAANGFTHPDCFALVYAKGFDPTNPLADLIAGDDDYSGAFSMLTGTGSGTRSSRIALGETSNFAGPTTGLFLTANTQYWAVVTGWGAGQQGTFRAMIGDGAGGGTVHLGAIPEPASLGLVGLVSLGLAFGRRRHSRTQSQLPMA